MSLIFVSPGPGGYAGDEYGIVAYGGGMIHAAPTVVVTAPADGAVITSSAPFMVSWTYAQLQGVVQSKYRVRIVDHVTPTTIYYDSGILSGAAASALVDPIAAGIPTDGTVLDAVVWVQSADGPAFQALSTPYPTGFTLALGVITAAITSPSDGSSQLTPVSSIKVIWTGEPDSLGNHITAVRVRLLAADSAFQYADSGFVAWNHSLDPQFYFEVYPFVNGTHYRFELQLRNSNGALSNLAFSSFWYSAAQAECVPLATVGTLYECAINGQGYMLFDGNQDVGNDIRTELLRRTRATAVLAAPRLATTQTPFNEAIERYTFFGGSEYRGGMGQQNADRTSSDDTAFFDSVGINPFEKHQVTLLHSNSQVLADTFVPANAAAITGVTASGAAYVISAASTLKHSTDLSSWTTLAITKGGAAPIVISDLTSDGVSWYAAGGTDGILRGTTSDPAAQWSTVPATLVRWAGQRVCVAYPSALSSTSNVFSTLNDSGAEEVVNGRIILPPGWAITDVTGGGGFAWFTAYNGTHGVVYKWDLTSATPSVAWELPAGQVPTAIIWYQGELVVRVGKAITGDVEVLLYLATESSGNLTPALLCSLGAAGDGGVGTFGANDKFVFYSWADNKGQAGLGAIDLATGGYARWHQSDSTIDPVTAIFMFNNRLCFMVSDAGLYAESLTSYLTVGQIQTSIHDGASNVDKIFDRVMLRFDPLSAGETVVVGITYDGGNSYASTGLTATTAGQVTGSADIGTRAQSGGLAIVLAGTGTTTPTVLIWQLQCHPTGKADLLLQLPIDCGDYISDLNGRPIAENGDGAGARRGRLLESLMASRVCVQDIDWFDTQVMEDFDVDDVKLVEVPAAIKEKQPGVARVKQVALITLRKSLR